MRRGEEQQSGSELLLDEYFAESDDRFVDVLLDVCEPRKLAAVTEKWKVDPRPWSRRMLWAYLESPWQTWGHNVVVKRLYKQAERQQDFELVAAFAHRFDCLVRRETELRWHWDSIAQQSSTTTALVLPRNGMTGETPGSRVATKPMSARQQRRWQKDQEHRRNKQMRRGAVLFSARTRYYLRRRAMRVLRRLAFRDPAAYVVAAICLLRRYRDVDLASGPNILDSWCLLQVCFRAHPALAFGRDHVEVREGHALQELAGQPAPRQMDAWRGEQVAAQLWALLAGAASRLVRVWTMAMLRAEHATFLGTLRAEQVRELFLVDDDEVHAFGIALLHKRDDLGSWALDDWLSLLQVESLSVQEAICDLMRAHVAAPRFSLTQVTKLAGTASSPIAQFGLELLGNREDLATDCEALIGLSRARCLAVAEDLAALALSVLGAAENYDVRAVIRFFDSPVVPVRNAAWAWLAPGCVGYDDPELWTRLLETPFESERLRLVRALTERQQLPGIASANLVPLWAAVLLGIHRGGRHKIQALHQLSRAAVADPDLVAPLLPVFAVAVRSVRPAEARVGLAALVAAVEHRPELRDAVQQTFPELRFVSNGATS